ncbi:hypothetical protein [Pseudomonas phage vB_Pae-PA152]|nr:hypothetical protein [Pseudomonas phage vB_Pae-PA152]
MQLQDHLYAVVLSACSFSTQNLTSSNLVFVTGVLEGEHRQQEIHYFLGSLGFRLADRQSLLGPNQISDVLSVQHQVRAYVTADSTVVGQILHRTQVVGTVLHTEQLRLQLAAFFTQFTVVVQHLTQTVETIGVQQCRHVGPQEYLGQCSLVLVGQVLTAILEGSVHLSNGVLDVLLTLHLVGLGLLEQAVCSSHQIGDSTHLVQHTHEHATRLAECIVTQSADAFQHTIHTTSHGRLNQRTSSTNERAVVVREEGALRGLLYGVPQGLTHVTHGLFDLIQGTQLAFSKPTTTLRLDIDQTIQQGNQAVVRQFTWRGLVVQTTQTGQQTTEQFHHLLAQGHTSKRTLSALRAEAQGIEHFFAADGQASKTSQEAVLTSGGCLDLEQEIVLLLSNGLFLLAGLSPVTLVEVTSRQGIASFTPQVLQGTTDEQTFVTVQSGIDGGLYLLQHEGFLIADHEGGRQSFRCKRHGVGVHGFDHDISVGQSLAFHDASTQGTHRSMQGRNNVVQGISQTILVSNTAIPVRSQSIEDLLGGHAVHAVYGIFITQSHGVLLGHHGLSFGEQTSGVANQQTHGVLVRRGVLTTEYQTSKGTDEATQTSSETLVTTLGREF